MGGVGNTLSLAVELLVALGVGRGLDGEGALGPHPATSAIAVRIRIGALNSIEDLLIALVS